jgi:hypothetical protein
MSSFLAVSAVTALLRDLLNDGLVRQRVPDILQATPTVEALPPDLVESISHGEIRLNLFLHKVSPNSGWRNVDLPSRNGDGERISDPPLALDLHYLLTAYAKQNFQAEILLGCAMQLLHETPVLLRTAIRQRQQAWSVGTDDLLKALATAELAEQAEQIKIVPHSADAEEVSKLWTGFQAHFRPTAAYQATVVLIESQRVSRSPLPVLTRGPEDRGVIAVADMTPAFPTLTAATAPKGQIGAQLGDVLTLRGHHLDGSNVAVRFTNHRLRRVLEVTRFQSHTPSKIAVRLRDAVDRDARAGAPPARPSRLWSAGVYSAAVLLQRPGETFRRTTNDLPFALAPEIQRVVPTRDRSGRETIFTVTCRPEVRPEQRASLTVGNLEIQAQAHSTPTDTLTFIARSVAPGEYFVRLRVDGVDSLLVDRSVTPPVFDPNQKVTVP